MKRISFKAFLSHRYKSADINLYFFKLFKSIAEVQFEIDEGVVSTNVTRLERMVRDADAFIGIYPFPGSAEEAYSSEELSKQSRYFRLEIDLAIRSQKPSIIFYDRRYGNLLRPPENVFSYSFDHNEITGEGGYPNFNKQKIEFQKFCEAIARKKHYDDFQIAKEKSTVAIILPISSENSLEIDSSLRPIREVIKKYFNVEIETIIAPCSLNLKLFRILEKIDFAIVDHAGTVAESGIPAYLHGKFIPMIRIESETNSSVIQNNGLNKFLLDGVEVGYNKDKIKWTTIETLVTELTQKLEIISLKVKRIKTFDEAVSYFLSATLRKEVIFVSYSGKDIDIAKEIINSLQNYFQTVFDYKDGTSIVPGQPWLDGIFDQLAKSAIGISLLSLSYLQSGNCLHEARQMVTQNDNGKMKLFPVKLYQEKLDLPEFLSMTQYLRKSDFASTKKLVDEIVRLST